MQLRLIMALLLVCVVRGEKLPLVRFGSAEGLPSVSIHHILHDSRGYMWLCTAEGVVFFDGYQLNPLKQLATGAKDMVEAKDHTFWLATRDGVAHYSPGAGLKMLPPGPTAAEHFVNSVGVDSQDVLWAGTDAGLFRLAPGNHFVRVALAGEGPDRSVSAILVSRSGGVWVGGRSGLSFIARSGQVRHETTTPVVTLAEATDGRIWIGTDSGACLVDPARLQLNDCLSIASGLPGQYVQSILQSSNGDLWMGTLSGLAHITRDHEKFQVRGYGVAEGLSNVNIEALAEDSSGAVWIGTDGGAAARMSSAFVSFGKDEGLDQFSLGLLPPPSGEGMTVLGRIEETLTISRLAGGHFVTTRLNLPAGAGWGQIAAQDDDGSWWLGTAEGVVHLSHSRVEIPSGWPRDRVFRLFRDSAGRIWMTTTSREGNQLLLASPSHNSIQVLTHAPGLPDITADYASSFAEDSSGDIWIGFLHSGVSRYHQGVFETFTAPGAPAGGVRCLYSGTSHQIWVGTSRQGLCRTSTEGTPWFSCYGTGQGLSGNSVLSIVADLRGRIYASTGKGVDRFEPASGATQHYTTSDGLVSGEIVMAARDSSGDIWFGTATGISRFSSKEDRPGAPPVVMIRELTVNGNPVALPELGRESFGPLQLSAGQNQLQIQFSAAGSHVEYSYRLLNADSAWSAPSPERSIHYVKLASGAYRFQVRAVNGDGVLSQTPAEAVFNIAAPYWRQWWFQVAAVLGIAGILYGLHTTRVRQLIAIERIRLRIAADLHDDIGSSLSQAAILSEAARRESANSSAADTMAQVASISREVVDSMSDIVWAINPQRDHVRDLAQRMRRFASDVLAAKDIEFVFLAPPDGFDRRVPADIRRQILLVFKEAVNNVARHSGASEARIEFRLRGKNLYLEVSDDGHGFDAAAPCVGNGLASMRQRVSGLGGVLKIEKCGLNGRGITLSATFLLK